MITETHQTKKHSGNKNSKEYIMLHHTGGWTYKSMVQYLCYSPAEVSCHYVVGNKGEIAKISDHKYITRHAGVSKYEGKTNLNNYAIGIEVVSDGHIFTDVQRDTVRKLVESIMKQESIPHQNIIRHLDVTPRKRDIGDAFRSNQFKTFKQYQESFYNIKEEMTEAEKKNIEAMIAMNSANWHNTDDAELQKKLEEMNTYLRSLLK